MAAWACWKARDALLLRDSLLGVAILGVFLGIFDSEKIRHDKVSVGSYTC